MNGVRRGRHGGVDELLNLLEIDPDALREAEFVQAQAILDTLVGETIATASMEESRIVVETAIGQPLLLLRLHGQRAAAASDR